jgi:RNA recognition motif-containing protein
MTPDFDKEKTKKIISLVLEKIKTEVDLQTLDEYRKLFKKETTLFNRSLVSAYLLMLCDQGKTIRLKDYGKRPVPSETDEAPDAQRYTLSENESTRLFFSVGRSRRVFTREILGIINTKTTVPREDIGVIRNLDNYSFVQVRNSSAEKIIEALNGMNFRGRPLTVNYAKSSEQNLNDPKKEDDI